MHVHEPILPFSDLKRYVLAVLAAALAVGLPRSANALPQGGQVAAGNVAIANGPGTMNLTQTGDAAIVNWADFSIAAGETVNIHQSGANASLLNRVLGANPSQLLGQLKADGRVYLVNPNGVLVGKDARIDAGGFFATTAQISDENFLAGGDLSFAGGTDASIVNLGVIKATDGDAVLVAYRVVNAGEVSAPKGTAALAAATEFVYAPAGDSRLRVVSSQGLGATGGVGVDNSGLVDAADAQLTAAYGNIYELAINQTGIVRATGVARTDGRVLLTSAGGSINVDGKISARRSDGRGGEVLIGGDLHGANPEVNTAKFTTVGADAVIDVSSSAPSGNGGRAIVWADQQTDFTGRIDGRAGAQGGDGGFAEVSGKHILNFNGFVDLTAANGSTGDLLLDPDEAIISTATDDQANGVFNNGVLATALGTANVTVDTSTGYGNGTDKFGSISVNDAVVWTSGNTLTLKSGDNINVNANLTGGAGSGVVFALGFGDFSTPTTGNLNVDAAATVAADTVTIRLNTDANPPGMGNGPAENVMGGVAFNGVLQTSTLDLALNAAGISGDVTLANAANAIGTLTTSSAASVNSSNIDGSVNIVDGSGDLTVSGTLWASSNHTIQITTPGDLTLTSGTVLKTVFSDITLASTGGSFINQAGTGAINNEISGRTLIYSDNPTDTTLGGLAFAPVYNKTLAGNAPGTITQTGSRVLYSLAPTVTFTADDLARTYGSANATLTYAVTGLVGGDTAGQAFTGTPVLATTATSGSNAGSYAITTAAGTVTASDYDYQIAFAPGTLTVNPAPLTIKADDQSRSFGVANPTLTATFTGLVNGDTSAALPNLTITTAATPNSPDGSYAIVPAGATNPNYSYTFTNGVLSIGASTVTIRADDFARIFGDANPTFTGVITAPSGFDQSLLTNLTYSTTATQTSNVGTYTITPSVDPVSGINLNLIDGTLTINVRPLTITALDAARLYGAANPTLAGTLTGLAPFQTAADIAGLAYTTSATATSNVGTYAIATSVGSNPNYAITTHNATLTVNQAPLTIIPVDASKIYADNNPTFTVANSGLVLGQSLADIGSLSLSTAGGQFGAVGTYAINAAFTSTTSLEPNYAVTFLPGTFTINPRPLTITASSATRLYGDPNPTFTYTSTGTNPPGITNASLGAFTGVTVGTTATAASDVGSYALTPSGATNSNYVYTYVPGTLTVDPSALTITANSVARTYGAANPTFTSTATGLKLTDTINDVIGTSSITTTAGVTSNVGTYPISLTGTPLTSNYAVTFVPGTLTVNKAPLLVAPAPTTRYYGDPNPQPELNVTGLLNGDSAAVVTAYFNSTAGFSSPVGNYTLTLIGASALNYDITSIGTGVGTLTVLPRPLTITADSVTRLYGDANPVFTATYNGLASFDAPSVITGLTFTTLATASSGVGVWGISPAGATNSNYAITQVPGQLTINPAPLTFNLDGLTRIYGRADAEFTLDQISGIKNSDPLASLGLSVTGPAPTAGVGTYDVAVQIGNPNYTVTNQTGTMEVTPAPLRVGVDRVVRDYGDPNPTAAPTGVTVGGLAFGQQAADVIKVLFPGDETLNAGIYDFATELFSPNYYVASIDNQFIVRQRSLLIKPANIVRYYGDPSPGFTYLLAGRGLASFDTLADLGDLSTHIQYGVSGDARTNSGTYYLNVLAAGGLNPNYAVQAVPGVMVIVPRPVTIDVADATMSEGQPYPDFSFVSSDLASFDTRSTVFLALTYKVLVGDAPYPVQEPFTLADVVIPTAYADATFTGDTTPTDNLDLGPTLRQSEISLPAFPPFGVTYNFPTLIAPPGTELTPEQVAARAPLATYYVLADFTLNPNYRLVGSTNGTLQLYRAPEVIARVDLEATGLNRFLTGATDQTLYNPFTGRDEYIRAATGVYGLPLTAMPVLQDALRSYVDDLFARHKINDPLYLAIKEAARAAGYDATGVSAISDAEMIVFLSNLKNDPARQAIFAPVFADLVKQLAGRDPSTLSAGENDLAIAVNNRVRAAKAEIQSSLKAKLEDWKAEQAAFGDNMAVLVGGRDVPYGTFVGELVQESLEQKAGETAGAIGGHVAGEAAVAGVAAVAYSLGTEIFPYAVQGAIRAGQTAAQAAAGVSFTAAAFPVAVLTVAVQVSVERAIQLGKNEEERVAFDTFVNADNSGSLSSLNLDPNSESLTATLDSTALVLALTGMVTGG